jgi:predicted enzyme related to lactoylglutathione lyase
MTTQATPPTYRTGKICYIEIPATDVQQSAEFYNRAFGWQIRKRGDGSTAFDDTVNEVSGAWVLGRPVAADPGLMVYVMVASAAAAIDAVVSAGGEIVKPVDHGAREVVATFRDPAGNLMGIYRQPGLAETEAPDSSAAIRKPPRSSRLTSGSTWHPTRG